MVKLNIEMPKNCGECPLCYRDGYYSNCKVYRCPFPIKVSLAEQANGIDIEQRHKNCPLIATD